MRLLASVAFSVSKDLAFHGHLPNRVDSAFQFALCAIAIAAAVARREWAPQTVGTAHSGDQITTRAATVAPPWDDNCGVPVLNQLHD
jgi:hypothetical protein